MKTIGKMIALLMMGAAVLLTSCDEGKICVVGSGTTQEYPLNMSGFNEVSLSGAMDLLLKESPGHEAIIVAEPEIFAVLKYSLAGEALEIGTKNSTTCIETGQGILVKVAAPVIKKIDISGESEIRSDGDLDESNLEIQVSGVADVALTGTATQQVIDVSGAVDVSNFGLISETVDIKVSGSGTFEVYAETTLNIDVSGDATIYYKGHPQVTQRVSGKLQLIDAN